MAAKSKILLVDDRKENLVALERMLEDALEEEADIDAHILTASSGQEALKSALRHEFALIILDVQMPNMDGFELAELLRGKKATQHVPIIFLSAVYSSAYSVMKGYKTGAVDFLEKPLISQILINKVKTFVQLDQQKRMLLEAEAQLIQSAKMAALGEMAAGIAHELNQPLQSISMCAELINMQIEKGVYEDVSQNAQHILAQIKRAASITNYLRTYSEKNRRTDFQLIDLGEVIAQTLVLQRKQLQLDSIELQMELADDLPRIQGNAILIEQVLTNLLINAKDAVRECSVKKILLRSFQYQDYVVVEMEDNGEGIAVDILDKIFDPFFTTKVVGEGTGLGLSKSQSIIISHLGQLTVRNGDDCGAIFRISIPAAVEGS